MPENMPPETNEEVSIETTAGTEAVSFAATALENAKATSTEAASALKEAKAYLAKCKTAANVEGATAADVEALTAAETAVEGYKTTAESQKATFAEARKALSEAKKVLKAEGVALRKTERESKKLNEIAAANARKELDKMPTRNGMRRPKPGTKTGRIWEIADNISGEIKAPASRAAVLEVAKEEGANLSMAVSQYSYWRKFNGVTGRVVAPMTAEQVAKAAADSKAAADAKASETDSGTYNPPSA